MLGREATGIYTVACPNCGRSISDERLFAKLPCPRCLGEAPGPVESIVDVASVLEERGRLNPGSPLGWYASIEREAGEVEALFEKMTGSRLWSAQRVWVKRALKRKSFAIIAPTGMGKTTFGVLMAIYFASRGEKSYIVVPTTPLVQMVEERITSLAARAGLAPRVLAIHSRLRTRERRERLKRLLEGDYDILVTTSSFLIRRAEELANAAKRHGGFRMVFVDDVDAVLKSGKSVQAVLRVVGFPPEAYEPGGWGWKLLDLRRRLVWAAEKALKEYEESLEKLRSKLRGKSREKVMLLREEILEARTRAVKKHVEPVYNEIRSLERLVEKAREKAATLIVSSATGRPRGRMVRLFSVLLGFQAGSRSETIRNIVDAYTLAPSWDEVEERLVEVVERLLSCSRRCGGIVYVPVDRGVAYAEQLAEKLRSRGIAAEAFTSKNIDALERFRRGETSVLVGVAVYYGVAVRGLDIPERICYAVFAGVPRIKFSARFEDPHPNNILRALSILAEHAPRDVAEKAETLLARLRRLYQRLSQAAVQAVAEALREGRTDTPAAQAFAEALGFIRESLSRRDVWEALGKARDIAVVRENGRNYIMVPDAPTYIQASGRTSRLYAGGITRGLSIVVADDERLLNGLMRRVRWYTEAEWVSLESLDIEKTVEELEKSREDLLAVVEGRKKPEPGRELVKTALLIVESPNKARTIANFFGRPSVREIGPLRAYEVSTGDYMLIIAASGGHVYDLVKPLEPRPKPDPEWLLDEVSGSTDGVKRYRANIHGVVAAETGSGRVFLPVYAPLARCMVCGHQWAVDPQYYNPYRGRGGLRCPVCGSPYVKSSWEIVEALRDIASEVDVVFIGTDPDTEGEKIGWDIASLIAPYARSMARVEFHEITRKAILAAIREPKPYGTHRMSIVARELGGEVEVPAVNLVKAQLVRRVEDRWIGFTLSPILWEKFWPSYCRRKIEKTIERRIKRYARISSEEKRLNKRINNDSIDSILGDMEKIADRKRRINEEKSIINEALRVLREELKKCERPNYNLSAGRVQTPVLGWIVEHTIGSRRARIPAVRVEADEYELSLELGPEELGGSYRETAEKATAIIRALDDLVVKGSSRIKTVEEALQALGRIGEEARRLAEELRGEARGRARITVVTVEEEVVEVKPLPPYTTDTLLADAAAKLRLEAPETMRIAQDLFELGLITYHRTDSVRVSDAGIAIAREYLREKYGDRAEELFTPRTWGAGGAHEAIRPTRPIDADQLRRLVEEGIIQPVRRLTRRHYQVYDLIFRRFIASQMKPAKAVKQRAVVKIKIADIETIKTIERYVEVLEKGFLEIYPTIRVEKRLREKTSIDARALVELRPVIPPLTQAETISRMKERGIGRPSTYAKIIDTLKKRAYVVVPPRRRSLIIATERGLWVYDYLMRWFPRLVSEERTRNLQRVMDEIELGKRNHQEVLASLLRELHSALTETGEHADYAPPLA